MTTTPFDQPGPPTGDAFDWQAHQGRLLLLDVIEIIDHVPTVHTQPGERSPAIRANITVIDGPLPGEHFRDSFVFPKVLQGQLRNSVGRLVLGRLGQGVPTPGKNAAWQLNDASPQDQAAAQAWLAANRRPTVSSPAQAQAGQSEPPF